MDTAALITIIFLGVMLLATLIGLLVSVFIGSMKKFVVEKMAEADSHTDWTSEQKQKYVIDEFKKKYKLAEFILNCKNFIEIVIKYSKEINYKK